MTALTLEKAYDRFHHLRPVLVVEDDIDILSSLAELLRDDGYDVVTAANGYQALGQVKAHDPELIVLDLMMPQMDGWRFVRELRQRIPSSRAPVVLMSAAPDLAGEAERLGVAAWVQKPFRLDELLRLAHRWCPPALPPQPHA
ncbi:MAG TPA: response regulator [Polyangia bacterium]